MGSALKSSTILKGGSRHSEHPCIYFSLVKIIAERRALGERLSDYKSPLHKNYVPAQKPFRPFRNILGEKSPIEALWAASFRNVGHQPAVL
jgi:hypothetical protein